jgi:ubiquinone/menaquinone biosynthesis C-methylase UbiE
MEDQKLRQIRYHEKEHYRADQPRQTDNTHPYIAWLNTYRLRKAGQMMEGSLSGKTVLSVCGGDGQEADYFHREGADVTVIDLSAVALRAARQRNPALRCACTDAESLAFPDRSFDWAIVRDGLHHLARPIQGLYELDRVSREGFVILEGQDSCPVRVLSRLGLAENWDPAGGYVYRFSRREMRKVFSSMQTVSRWRIHTAWLPFGSDLLALFPAFKRFAYPALMHPAIYKVLDTRSAKLTFKAGFEAFGSLLGYWGNSLIVVAHKVDKTPSASRG